MYNPKSALISRSGRRDEKYWNQKPPKKKQGCKKGLYKRHPKHKKAAQKKKKKKRNDDTFFERERERERKKKSKTTKTLNPTLFFFFSFLGKKKYAREKKRTRYLHTQRAVVCFSALGERGIKPQPPLWEAHHRSKKGRRRWARDGE